MKVFEAWLMNMWLQWNFYRADKTIYAVWWLVLTTIFEYRSFEIMLEMAPCLVLKLAPPWSSQEDKRSTWWMYRDQDQGYENRAIFFFFLSQPNLSLFVGP